MRFVTMYIPINIIRYTYLYIHRIHRIIFIDIETPKFDDINCKVIYYYNIIYPPLFIAA